MNETNTGTWNSVNYVVCLNLMRRSRGPDPLKNYKAIRFLSNTGADPERNHKASKVKKTARIRNRYNQVPHLSQDTKWESNKIKMNITNKSQEVSPFPSGDHKAAMNRLESIQAFNVGPSSARQRIAAGRWWSPFSGIRILSS